MGGVIRLATTEVKLIALDLDGTLLNSYGEVSAYTERVVHEALANDIHVVLSTGRPLQLCSHIANRLNATNYLITNNGAEIWKNKEHVIERHFMDASTIKTLWEFGYERDLLMWMVTPTKLFRQSTRPDCFKDFEWLKFGFGNLNDSIANNVYEKLSKYNDLEITSSSISNIEINRIGVNKIEALKRVCAELQISLKNVMAIGDNLNDFQMIKKVGLGIAVDNATTLIKENARFITRSNDEDGVAKAIEKYVL